ncbi:hypothetical protein MCEMSEM29_00443 [Methylophilaceae bacterium]
MYTCVSEALYVRIFLLSSNRSCEKFALQKYIVEGFLLVTFQIRVFSCPAATLRNWNESNKI